MAIYAGRHSVLGSSVQLRAELPHIHKFLLSDN
jgi:hypothetical protein